MFLVNRPLPAYHRRRSRRRVFLHWRKNFLHQLILTRLVPERRSFFPPLPSFSHSCWFFNAGGGRFSRKNSPDALQNLSCFLRNILSHKFAKLEGVCKIIRSLNKGSGGFARDFFWFCINRRRITLCPFQRARGCVFWQFLNQAKNNRDKNNFHFVLGNAKRTSRSCGVEIAVLILAFRDLFAQSTHILLNHGPKNGQCNLLFQYEFKSLVGFRWFVGWFRKTIWHRPTRAPSHKSGIKKYTDSVRIHSRYVSLPPLLYIRFSFFSASELMHDFMATAVAKVGKYPLCAVQKRRRSLLVDSATLVSSSQSNDFLWNTFSMYIDKFLFWKIQLCSKQKLSNLFFQIKTKFFLKKEAILGNLPMFFLVSYVPLRREDEKFRYYCRRRLRRSQKKDDSCWGERERERGRRISFNFPTILQKVFIFTWKRDVRDSIFVPPSPTQKLYDERIVSFSRKQETDFFLSRRHALFSQTGRE